MARPRGSRGPGRQRLRHQSEVRWIGEVVEDGGGDRSSAGRAAGDHATSRAAGGVRQEFTSSTV